MERKARGLLAALLGMALAMVVGLVPGLAKTARADGSLVGTIIKMATPCS